MPFDFLVGCCNFSSSIPSNLNCMVNTRCFSWPICTWSLEVVNWTFSSCLCSSFISPLFLSSNIFMDWFSVFSSLNRSFVITSSDHVLLRCSLLAISRWSCKLLLLSYVKKTPVIWCCQMTYSSRNIRALEGIFRCFRYFMTSTWPQKAKLTVNFLAFPSEKFRIIWQGGGKYFT